MKDFVFGYAASRGSRIFAREPRSHMFFCGSARSGKGAASIAPNALRYSGNLICYDPKLENAWISAGYRASLGQRVVILDPHGELERQYIRKSAEAFPAELVQDFNPLLEVDPASPDYESALTDIADAIVDRTHAEKDPHWDDRAFELIIGALADCLECGEPYLPAMRARLMLGTAAFQQLIQRAIERAPAIRHEGKTAAYYLASFADDNKEMQGIFSSARRHTKFLDDRAMARHYAGSHNSFRLRDLAHRPMTLYLGLPPDKLDAFYPRWVRVMLIVTIRAILRERPRERVLFLIDEFATALGRIPLVERQFGLGAGLGLILAPYVQSLAQLSAIYGPSWESFLGNAAIKQFFGCGDQFTAEYLARLIGQYRRTAVSRHVSAQGLSVNTSEAWDQVMRPEAIRQFLSNRSIVIADEVPYQVKPLFYFREPKLKGRYRTPPEYLPALSQKAPNVNGTADKDGVNDSARPNGSPGTSPAGGTNPISGNGPALQGKGFLL